MNKNLFNQLSNFPNFPELVSIECRFESKIKKIANKPIIIIGKINN